jgi:hypothetical protein
MPDTALGDSRTLEAHSRTEGSSRRCVNLDGKDVNARTGLKVKQALLLRHTYLNVFHLLSWPRSAYRLSLPKVLPSCS